MPEYSTRNGDVQYGEDIDIHTDDGYRVIFSDMGGGLWGLAFGPVGSIIVGGVASALAEATKGSGGGPAEVPFWQCNPKWC